MSSNHSKKQTDNLAKRLDSFEAKYSTGNGNNDGPSDSIRWWKGKPIIPLDEWIKLSNCGEVFTSGTVEGVQRTKEALQYFPDDYGSGFLIFPKGVERKYTEEAFVWHIQFIELLKFKKHPQFKDIDMKAFIERLKYRKENPNWREEEYRRENPNAVHGPWDSFGFD